jgi:hypothetical protein
MPVEMAEAFGGAIAPAFAEGQGTVSSRGDVRQLQSLRHKDRTHARGEKIPTVMMPALRESRCRWE